MTWTRQDDALLALACIRARRERCICMCCVKSARLVQRSGTAVASMLAGAPYAGPFCAEFCPTGAPRFMSIRVAVLFTALGRGFEGDYDHHEAEVHLCGVRDCSDRCPMWVSGLVRKAGPSYALHAPGRHACRMPAACAEAGAPSQRHYCINQVTLLISRARGDVYEPCGLLGHSYTA